MSGIACAVRGGPDSQPTIEKAISFSKETGLQLYFLYVVNLEFLGQASSSRHSVVSEEMHKMGEFILLTAQSNATSKGVNAEARIRQGDVEHEIAGLCHEINADYLVLGRPMKEMEASIFTGSKLAKFIDRIEKDTGAKVVFPDEGS